MGWPNLSRKTIFSGANGDGKITFRVQLATSRFGHHDDRLMHNLLNVMNTYQYRSNSFKWTRISTTL